MLTELQGQPLPTRVKGRPALVRRLRGLLVAVHRYARHRAATHADQWWSARTIDALLIEQVPVARLADAAADAPELAQHWQTSIDRLRAILEQWPATLAAMGRIDLADRRNRILNRLAKRWSEAPPQGFTVAAGVTTAAPAVVAVLRSVVFMSGGLVVVPRCAPG